MTRKREGETAFKIVKIMLDNPEKNWKKSTIKKKLGIGKTSFGDYRKQLERKGIIKSTYNCVKLSITDLSDPKEKVFDFLDKLFELYVLNNKGKEKESQKKEFFDTLYSIEKKHSKAYLKKLNFLTKNKTAPVVRGVYIEDGQSVKLTVKLEKLAENLKSYRIHRFEKSLTRKKYENWLPKRLLLSNLRVLIDGYCLDMLQDILDTSENMVREYQKQPNKDESKKEIVELDSIKFVLGSLKRRHEMSLNLSLEERRILLPLSETISKKRNKGDLIKLAKLLMNIDINSMENQYGFTKEPIFGYR